MFLSMTALETITWSFAEILNQPSIQYSGAQTHFVE